MPKKKQSNSSIIFRSSALGLFAFLVAFAAGSMITPVRNTSATDDCTSSVTDQITCTENQNLTVTVNNNPLYYYINVVSAHGSAGTPLAMAFGSEDGRTAFGNIASTSDDVYVETNSPLTHQLMLSTTGTYTIAGIDSALVANNLVSTGTVVSDDALVANSYFAPGGGNAINSASALTGNTWGFALKNDSEGIPENNFDADYSDPALTSKWAKVPNSGSEVIVRQDTEPTSTTTVYYGALAQKNIAGGEYSNVILYTALAEQPNQLRVLPSRATSGATITIYTSINTTNISEETATITFYQVENDEQVTKATCSSPVIALDENNYLYVTCTVPEISEAGTYGVKLTLTNMAVSLSQDDVFTYASSASPQSDPQNVDNNQNQASIASTSNRSGIAFGGGSQSSSSSSSDSDSSATTVYNSPLGANNSDKTTTVAAATKSGSADALNVLAVAALAGSAVAAGGGLFFIIAKRRKEEEEEEEEI